MAKATAATAKDEPVQKESLGNLEVSLWKAVKVLG